MPEYYDKSHTCKELPHAMEVGSSYSGGLSRKRFPPSEGKVLPVSCFEVQLGRWLGESQFHGQDDHIDPSVAGAVFD